MFEWGDGRGSLVDPAFCGTFAVEARGLLADAEGGDALERVLEAEPSSWRLVSGDELDLVARAFGDLVDLKSPFFHGHSAGVAELVNGAADAFGLNAEETTGLRRAALLHDV